MNITFYRHFSVNHYTNTIRLGKTFFTLMMNCRWSKKMRLIYMIFGPCIWCFLAYGVLWEELKSSLIIALGHSGVDIMNFFMFDQMLFFVKLHLMIIFSLNLMILTLWHLKKVDTLTSRLWHTVYILVEKVYTSGYSSNKEGMILTAAADKFI